MNFEYEISADEYAAGQALYYRLKAGRNRVQSGIFWLLVGSLLIVVAWNQRPLGWAQFLLAMIAAYWIYVGIVSLSLWPQHFRRTYPASELAGKIFKAELNEDGFSVTGDLCSWHVRWQGVSFKDENEHAFMLYSYGTIFVFAKKYVAHDQQEQLRRLSGLDHQKA